MFKLKSKYKPSGDQPAAINKLLDGLKHNEKDQVLLGITGSGKTFTIANVISQYNRPTLLMAHNKTLAAQLYQEMKDFFPENHVEYFVSYYDYYQPEAYIAKTDTYIEKDSAINEQIDIMRYSATKALLEHSDTIVVSSVSSIYGLGSPEEALNARVVLEVGFKIDIKNLIQNLVNMQYIRTSDILERGKFRVNGDILYIFEPSSDNIGIKIEFFGDQIEKISNIDPLTNVNIKNLQKATIYPNTLFSTSKSAIYNSIDSIKNELEYRVEFFEKNHMFAEAQRIKQRTNYDIEMMVETGSCKGIENYSRYLTGRLPGQPPVTLFNYVPKDGLIIVDESHVMLPQIKGMYAGDKARKDNLITHGFRLPSAYDNRPLRFEEWDDLRPKTIYVSATPGDIELEKTQGIIVQQIIRPTGLLDPICEIRPTHNQINDAVQEIKKATQNKDKALCLALTKSHAEKISEKLNEIGVRSRYIHADIETLERVQILHAMKKNEIDVIVGINLLREGIDLPECSVVLLLDADKEGFLRSKRSLIQIIGRAARNDHGKAILYADKETESIKYAITETKNRRELQEKYNKENNIIPKTIIKEAKNIFDDLFKKDKNIASTDGGVKYEIDFEINPNNLEKEIKKLKKQMKSFAKELDFENAKINKDKIGYLTSILMNFNN